MIHSETRELLDDDLGGALLLEGELGVFVQRPAKFDQSGEQCLDLAHRISLRDHVTPSKLPK